MRKTMDVPRHVGIRGRIGRQCSRSGAGQHTSGVSLLRTEILQFIANECGSYNRGRFGLENR